MTPKDTLSLQHLLAPAALAYGLITGLRNLLFNWGIFPSEEYGVPVICVGNLAAGGTGKTPHTEYLIRLLKPRYRLGILSRGYKRRTRGFRLAGSDDTALTLGDEPYQMKRKFADVPIAVDANRRRGIRKLLALPEGRRPEVILLDDAFQHRWVRPSFSILLTDYGRLFYKDRLLPWGLLRESKTNMYRADVIIVSKCIDSLRPIDFRIIGSDMKLQAYQRLYFTRITYGKTLPVFPSHTGSETAGNFLNADNEALLVAGIASPGPLLLEAEKRYPRVVPMLFPDHHAFNSQDMRKIKQRFDRMDSPDKFILVTEKDAARLLHNPLLPEEWKRLIYYLPITVEFCTEASLPFDSCIFNHILSFQRNHILH
jgi:tetraacyldisaccharide 4'-kinase